MNMERVITMDFGSNYKGQSDEAERHFHRSYWMFWPNTPFPCIQVENIFFLWMLRIYSVHWVTTKTNPAVNNSFRWPQSSKCACVIYLYRKLWDRDISVAHRLCLAWLTVPSKTYSNILVYLSSATHNDCYAGASVYFLLWRCKVCIFVRWVLYLFYLFISFIS